MQIWISTHFGVICERLPSADEMFLSIKAIFTPPAFGCKPDFEAFIIDGWKPSRMWS